MKRKLALWGLAGFVVALSWVLLGLEIRLSSQPILLRLAQLTFPVALFGRHPIQWYWAVLSNIPVYLLVGLVVEGFARLTHLPVKSA